MSATEIPGRSRSPRAIVALLMAAMVAIFALLFVLEEYSAEAGDTATWLRGSLGGIAAQAVGGAIAGWLLAGLFGRRGIGGWVLSLLGGVLVTLVAGLLGGLVMSLPSMLADGLTLTELITVGMSLLLIPMAAAGKPLAAISWLVIVALTHLLAARAR